MVRYIRTSPSTLWILLALLGPAACRSGNASNSGSPDRVVVKVLTLKSTLVKDTSEYIAVLKSRRSIQLQPQVEGRLTRILVKSGDEVAAGKLLMQIDPAHQQASVASAQANHASRMATLNYSKEQYDRAKRLYEGGAVSQQELDQSYSNLLSARADANAVGAQIRQTEVQLDYYRIIAPAHGFIGDIPVHIGDRVSPLTTLTTLDENGLLEAHISVPVERSKELKPDMEVELIDTDGATIATNRVTFISPQVSQETQSILIKTVVENQNGKLRADQFARARVVWSSHEGLLLPAMSVVRLNGQSFVYVAEGEKEQLSARLRPIALGQLLDGDYIVAGGLKANERVVTAGMYKLWDGAPLAVEP